MLQYLHLHQHIYRAVTMVIQCNNVWQCISNNHTLHSMRLKPTHYKSLLGGEIILGMIYAFVYKLDHCGW